MKTLDRIRLAMKRRRVGKLVRRTIPLVENMLAADPRDPALGAAPTLLAVLTRNMVAEAFRQCRAIGLEAEAVALRRLLPRLDARLAALRETQ